MGLAGHSGSAFRYDLVPYGLSISQVVHLKWRLSHQLFREGGQGWPWR